MSKKVLVSGGAGYIGSHTVVELCEEGYTPFIVDDFSNSKPEVLNRLEEITKQKIKFIRLDLKDRKKLEDILREVEPWAVIHFAGYKAVGESVEKPLMYYRNNLDTTLSLLEAMEGIGCTRFIFSSSATVYGTPERVPIPESAPTFCTNPYGWTKWMIEQILQDYCKAKPEFSACLLRYFNPIGAHPSGRIGEDPKGIPNNLMPYITQVAIGKREKLSVFGNDYPTPDGTGVRDYIHVVDLARGHVAALDYVLENKGCMPINLGTGKGYSVLEMLQAFVRANDVEVPYEIVGRRAGDIASCYADSSRAKELLGWSCEYELDEMCRDSWNWQKNNPEGYGD